MNILDFILIVIFISCLINGYRKGFFRKLFDLLAFIIGIIIFNFLYPIINSYLIKSNVFKEIKNWVIYDLNLDSFTAKTQEEIVANIQNLELPNIMKNLLIENNNEVFHKIFKVDNVVDYIANFITTIIINFLASIIVIIVTFIIIKILSKTTSIISNIPVLSTFDKISGLVIGGLIGIVIILALCLILVILSIFPQFAFLKSQFNGILTEPIINDNILIKALLNLILGVVK